jgi:CubicO group peptidase (beta-lactamase class C family)
MRTRILRFFLISTAASLLSGCSPPTDDKISKRLDEIVRFRVENNEFTGSVLVAKDHQILLNKGYGLANREWNIPNTPTTKYRIGSVTKQFTAAAILLLEEQGKLKVEDLVKTHWPEAPPAWEKITIFHLLTHTSGIPSVTNLPDFKTWRLLDSTAEKTTGYVRDNPLEFPPGSEFHYSNSGYILLGYLIERISGQSYAEFLNQKVFTPLNMKDSGVDSDTAIIERRASGYTPGDDGPENASYTNMTFPHGAGALYSTTEDLLRWNQGLFGGKLLSPESLKKITTPFKNDYAFGLGIVKDKDKDRTLIAHSGGIEGFNTNLSYYPDEKLTIAVLANLNGDAPDQLTQQLSTVLHGETIVLPSERVEIRVSEDSLRKFAGLYELSPDTNAIITVSGGKLFTQLGSEEPEELLAESATRFFSRSIDGQIEFEQDAQGVVTGLILHLDGGKHPAKRLPERVEVKLPPEVLNRYAGTYRFETGLEVVMTVEDGRLRAKPQDQQPKDTLYAEAEDHFFSKSFNAQVEFTKNKAGQTTGLIFHKGGEHTRAPRLANR